MEETGKDSGGVGSCNTTDRGNTPEMPTQEGQPERIKRRRSFEPRAVVDAKKRIAKRMSELWKLKKPIHIVDIAKWSHTLPADVDA